MKEELIKKLKEIVKELTEEDVKIEINRSNDSSHGDWTTNIALQIFARGKGEALRGKFGSPRDLAQEIVEKFESQPSTSSGNNSSLSEQGESKGLEGIEKVEVAGPGFINFYVSINYLVDRVTELQNSEFNFPNIGQNRPAVVEYSSPNIAKPFTIGHLRSTIIGDAIANLLEAVEYHVYRDNHLGDWGTQFGKQIYAIKTWGNEAEIDKSSDPIKELVALYVKFHEEAEKNPELEEEGRKWFKRLEDKDPEAIRLWLKCIDWSFKEFERIYGELGVHFTENGGKGYGEAFFEDKMGPIIDELREKGFLKESQGAQLVFYPNDVLPPLMILKQDGATLYATRDLATDKFRLGHYGKDVLVINEVGAEQSLYWRQLYMLEEMLGWYQRGQRVHVGHGLFRFKEGKMSTRKGNVIWLEDVLDEAKQRALGLTKTQFPTEDGSFGDDDLTTSKISDGAKAHKLDMLDTLAVAKQVAIGAIKWNDLRRSAHLDVTFDWDEVLNMQGNSGPYIQYSYVRTKSILERAGVKDGFWTSQNDNYSLNPEELAVLRELDKFAEVVEQAAVTYSPNVVAQYLFELAQLFNNFYQKHRIVNAATEEEKEFRLALTRAVGAVLQKGLNLLGIVAPDKM